MSTILSGSPVVELYGDVYAEALKHVVDNLQQVNFVEQRVGAYNVGVTLIEFAIASFLRAVGAPYWLNLESLERELQFAAVLNHEAGKWHSEVVAQPLFAESGCQSRTVAVKQLFVRCVLEEVSGVEYFEKQFIAFFSVFAH